MPFNYGNTLVTFVKDIAAILIPHISDGLQTVKIGTPIGLSSENFPLPREIEFENLGDPETHGRWSIGHSFSLSTPRPSGKQAKQEFVVEFVHPFLPRGRLDMTVYLNGQFARQLVFDGKTDRITLHHAMANLPPCEKVVMTCVLFDPMSPSDAGLSTDSRCLGIMVRSFAFLEATEASGFRHRQNNHATAPGTGWFPPDSIRWAQEDPAELRLPISMILSPHADLVLKVETLVAQPKVTLKIDGRSQAPQFFKPGANVLKIDLFPFLRALSGRDLCLVFEGFTFAVPDELIRNGDRRRIGIGLSEVSLHYRPANQSKRT